MANETVASGVEELIPTEKIGAWVQGYPRAPRTFETVGWLQYEPELGSVPFRFPRAQAFAVPAGTKTEAAEFTRVAFTTAESSITPGIVGFELAITDESAKSSVLGRGFSPQIVAETVEALQDRKDSDGLASIASATNTMGAESDSFTLDHLVNALGQWAALNNRSGPMGDCAIIRSSSYTALMRDIIATSGPAAAVGAAGMFGTSSGYKTEYLGCHIFTTSNVPAHGAGYSNCVTGIGNGFCGLGQVIVEDVKAGASERGSEGQRSAESYTVVRAWYGSGVANPDKVLEVLSA